jgi:SOS-response transcriptional repressor LexA
MGWATAAIERLRRGHPVTVRPRGHSMTGKVNDGDTVTVEPLTERAPQVGDIVLCKVRGREYLHLVKAVQGERYLIGNNRGRLNGWVGRAAIFGVATCIARSG